MSPQTKVRFAFVIAGVAASIPIAVFMNAILHLKASWVMPFVALICSYFSVLFVDRTFRSSSLVIKGVPIGLLTLIFSSSCAAVFFHGPGVSGFFWAFIGFTFNGLLFFGLFAALVGWLTGLICKRFIGSTACYESQSELKK